MEVNMPPKVKITKEDIVKTALELVRAEGEEALNARSIAAALGCSTQPIFSNFETMDELREAVAESAYELYLGFIENEVKAGKYPAYKASGMAYIRFAKEEKQLFRLLFMCDRTGRDLAPTADFESSIEIIMKSCGLPRERAALMHLEMWACVHGIGVMLATSFLPLEWELISGMLTDVYLGTRERHMTQEG